MATKHVPLALMLCVSFGAASLAHDMWLESDSFLTEPGERITIRNGNGTIYEKSENAVTPDRVAMLTGMGPGGASLRLEKPRAEGQWLELPFRPEDPGSYWIGLATKPRTIRLEGADFNEYLEHDDIPRVLAQRKQRGILDREEVEEYSKYVKLFLQVGEEQSDNHARPLGLKIEIVPLAHPYRLRPGDELPVRVLYDGEPLSELAIHAGYAGQAGGASHHVTDEAGEAVVPITSAGRWYVRGIHLFQVDEQDHSYESYWATLTFEIVGTR